MQLMIAFGSIFIVMSSILIAGAPIPKDSESLLTCRLVVRNPKDRLAVASEQARASAKNSKSTFELPDAEVDNPLIYSAFYATAQVDNLTAKDVNLILLRESKAAVFDAFIATITVADDRGRVLEIAPSVKEAMPETSETIDRIAKILDETSPKVIMKRRDHINLPCSIFAVAVTEPGTYSVQLSVSYIESDSRTVRKIAAEPLKITITKEHLEASKLFRSSK